MSDFVYLTDIGYPHYVLFRTGRFGSNIEYADSPLTVESLVDNTVRTQYI